MISGYLCRQIEVVKHNKTYRQWNQNDQKCCFSRSLTAPSQHSNKKLTWERIKSNPRELILHDCISSTIRFGLLKPAEKHSAISHIIYFSVKLTQNNYVTKEGKPTFEMRHMCSIFVGMCNIICVNKLSSFYIKYRGKRCRTLLLPCPCSWKIYRVESLHPPWHFVTLSCSGARQKVQPV